MGPIRFAKPLRQGDEIFTERKSLVFKRLRVLRMVDAERNALVYLAYSDRLIESCPKNAVTAVLADPSLQIALRGAPRLLLLLLGRRWPSAAWARQPTPAASRRTPTRLCCRPVSVPARPRGGDATPTLALLGSEV